MQEETYNQSLSPGDIQFDSFDKMQKSSPTVSPIKYDDSSFSDPNDENKQSVGNENQFGTEDDDHHDEQSGLPGDHSSSTKGSRDGGDGNNSKDSRGFGTPPSARKEGSDYLSSVAGMKSAFSFCTSPM